MLRPFLLILGTLSVVLGILGMLLPLLPTTPFMLLAASCYARSSERFYRGLIQNRWCGEYIRNYREGRGIPVKQKVITLILLWITITSTIFFANPHFSVKMILFGVALGVTVYLLRVKNFKQSPANTPVLSNESLSEESA